METIVKESKKVWFSPTLTVHGNVHQLTAAPGPPDPPGKIPGVHDVDDTQMPKHWAS